MRVELGFMVVGVRISISDRKWEGIVLVLCSRYYCSVEDGSISVGTDQRSL